MTTTDPAAHRNAWIKDHIRNRTPHTGVTIEEHARMVADAEREWAKRHPAVAARLAVAS
jgi:hypothetical protein